MFTASHIATIIGMLLVLLLFVCCLICTVNVYRQHEYERTRIKKHKTTNKDVEASFARIYIVFAVLVVYTCTVLLLGIIKL